MFQAGGRVLDFTALGFGEANPQYKFLPKT